MSNIAKVIGWKFNDQPGMDTTNNEITKFPGGIPSQSDQDVWAAEYESYLAIKTCKDSISVAMQAYLVQGIKWRLNNSAEWSQISLDGDMQHFFVVANAERMRGRVSPHNGKIWQGDVEFDVNDVGIEELAEFAGAWGLKVAQIARAEKCAVDLMTMEQIEVYDPTAIDWTIRDATIGTMTITNWTSTDIANKWIDNTCQQNP